ncbi:hypothetical protein ZWY2020_046095 [Hordeum vulgare]|nr:hypothetical protein ZWY2020_046095 [Hordeum vulgare]
MGPDSGDLPDGYWLSLFTGDLRRREIARKSRAEQRSRLQTSKLSLAALPAAPREKITTPRWRLPWLPPRNAQLSSACWRPPFLTSTTTYTILGFHNAGDGEGRDRARLYSGEPTRARPVKYLYNFDPAHGPRCGNLPDGCRWTL